MLLVDTSVWIDHLRTAQSPLAAALEAGRVLIHPFVLGEIALGSLHQRPVILDTLSRLPQATVAHDSEVLAFIDANTLHGCGIGYLDAHLLASVRLTPGASLWTHDKRLQAAAQRLGLSRPAPH